MAEFKPYSYEQQLMIPVGLSRQLLPGTFEYMSNILIDEKIDLSIFYEKYNHRLSTFAFTLFGYGTIFFL